MTRSSLANAQVSDVLCLGETMVLFATPKGAKLATSPFVNMYVGGAESNVAIGLAHLGHDVEWFGRLGRDQFGVRIRDFLVKRGVHTSRVIMDEERPTGVYFKDSFNGQSDVYYYRAGSAASALNRSDVERLALGNRRLCHLSGITPALSDECSKLVERVIIDREPPSGAVSFDVNYRPQLWDVATAAPRLLEFARASDIVIVGRDEAEVLWSTGDAQSVRELLPDVPELIVKDAHLGATHFDSLGTTYVTALGVEVVEPVGAGDAFAAGYLAGWLDGWDIVRSLRLGHLVAAFTLQHASDLPTLPNRTELFKMVDVEESEWLDMQLPDSNENSVRAADFEGLGLAD